MIKRDQQHSDNGTLSDAAAWYTRLRQRNTDISVWNEFSAWLEASTEHRLAFEQVEALYEDLDEFAETIPVKFSDAVEEDAVQGRQHRKPVFIGLGLGTLAAASLMITVGIKHPSPAPSPVKYTTAIGARKTVELADGSTVELRSGTTISVDFSAKERHVRVTGGDALFQVAKHLEQPFVVTAGGVDIRDIGTVFAVARSANKTIVTVSAGQVSVSPNTESAVASFQISAVELSAGDRWIETDGLTAEVVRVDGSAAKTAAAAYLNYENTPLSKIVDDLNLRFGNKVLIHDPATAAIKFSGVLTLDDEQDVVNRLAKLLSLAVDRARDGTIILRTAS